MSLLSRLAVQAARAYGILSSNPNNVPVSYLVVAGGGGGGSYAGGGGGGAGGYQTSTFTLSILNTYSITVGAGGVGGVNATPIATNGSNSVISGTGLTTITSTGGGFGAGYYGSFNTGASGGSGGGNAYNTTATGGTGTSGQGNNGGGGSGGGLTHNGAGGGGGASAVGGNSNTSSGAPSGNGGAGSASSISGSSVTYAGGGGGGNFTSTAGTGGSGGGGNGGSNASGSAGTVNLGGGGGGSGSTGGAGGAGGSGVVIISYTSATPRFVGGTLTTSGGNQIHTFTSSGTLSPLTPVTASYLVVAGGGSGSASHGGGGGAGGLLTSSTTLYSGATYVVTVGAGGVASGIQGAVGFDGSTSSISGTGLSTISSGGGGGGGAGFNSSSCVGRNGLATNGNGGGAGGGTTSSGQAGGSGNGAGFAGGSMVTNGTAGAGGGGGGAGAVGANATGSGSGGATGGVGGVGLSNSITGSAVFYAGGGGGSGWTTNGAAGGNGGGGAGGNPSVAGVSGTANTGGGGGAAGDGSVATGGNGGSGVVIISYAGSQVFNGGLVTSSGGNTIHTFNATGALTPLTNNLNNSLRFRKSASAYLNRTPSVTGNRQTWTWSAWVKRSNIGSNGALFDSGQTGSDDTTLFELRFQSDALAVAISSVFILYTTAVYRDPSAWYHIVLAIDTTQATAANRAKLYVNGSQVTSFSSTGYPTQNTNFGVNLSGNPHKMASNYNQTASESFDGYMSDINFIDGQALEPYYFGNNDANGVWKPILYKGTYGTNGFYLTFADTSALTTSSNAGLGKDTSGNGNYWTTNNISITAGVTYDAMTDVPTNTSATVANYAVMNPLWTDGSVVIAQGNLNVSGGNYGGFSTLTIPTSSKFYAEFTVTATQGNQGVGILKAANAYSGVIAQADMFGSNSVTYYSVNGNKFVLGGGSTAYGSSWGTINDVIGIAVDTVNNQITFYKNNTSQGVITGLTSGIEWVFATGNQTSTGGGAWNFGQRPFTYTAPSGFVALNTYNLPTPTILQGNKYMDATLYTGTGTALNVVNQGQFKPDFVWGKDRAQAQSHLLFDSVRGVYNFLSSNSTSAESTNSTTLTAFNSNGFQLGTNATLNQSGISFVGWQWQANQGSTVSNTSGTITSTVSVNTTAGFSVVTYTGTGANATVGHGLGVAPKMLITKDRTGGGSWQVYHASLGNTGGVYLNSTAAFAASSGWWNNTSPTSTTISIGTNGEINTNGRNYVAYCWAEIAGFSSFGSYTANASADGPFIYTGFRPRWIMFKRSTSATNWYVIDTAISPYNSSTSGLYPNTSGAESTEGAVNILSNGFKCAQSSGAFNYPSGETFIYAAFAENPFKNANAR